MLHPDFKIQIENARLQDIRNAETARHLEKIVQGSQPNHLKAIAKSIATFAQQFRSQLLKRNQQKEHNNGTINKPNSYIIPSTTISGAITLHNKEFRTVLLFAITW